MIHVTYRPAGAAVRSHGSSRRSQGALIHVTAWSYADNHALMGATAVIARRLSYADNHALMGTTAVIARRLRP